ncbi:DNA-processing protein DprA [Orlajensenia leifsoniae]|uniref:DNA-protecting protein DprA n=1 Tax=Orlajensenia leifsoniae TaxID=2561933 RepID=A0A4Y9R460_9MICO|nr:DNA-processing protein DprA [Leifsonia flava]TFV99339.1 DNA-protecting protein DprA [Leifsonia flava]
MTRFGIADAEIARLVSTVRPDAPPDQDAADHAFARAAWSLLAEPGDRAAGVLITALGADDALESLLREESPESLARRLDPAGAADRTRLTKELGDGCSRWRPRLRSGDVVQALVAAAASRTRLLLPDDAHWPDGVDDLGVHAPIALWMRGVDHALHGLKRSIALVGARAASLYGEQIASDTASGLADRGLTIVSGAAYGIDGMAHRSALASGGLTVAFLAGGVDRFYPAGHDDLLSRIATVGAVISELPCGSQPTKWRFLQRNRLIAASSQATVVLEAGWRSGSLNTAGHAAALGRPLGAVPGPITSVTSAGCHRLIRDYDAVCVTSVEEMLELLPDADPTASGPAASGGSTTGAPAAGAAGAAGRAGAEPTSDELRVLDALSSRTSRSVDEIARRSGLAVAVVVGVLGTLDLDERALPRGSGWIRRR